MVEILKEGNITKQDRRVGRDFPLDYLLKVLSTVNVFTLGEELGGAWVQ
jgi:hypothetical protein